MGFLGGFLSSRQDEIYERDAQRLLALCRSYGPKERGRLWAAGALAKAYLVLDHQLDEAQRRLGEKPLAPVVAAARTHPAPKLMTPE